jgi:hypothetical protein
MTCGDSRWSRVGGVGALTCAVLLRSSRWGWESRAVRGDRAILSSLSRLLPKAGRRWACLLVSPRTVLRWHSDLVKRRWTYRHRRIGRPPIAAAIRVLVLEMARDNPTWGYRRIYGELAGLGHTIAFSTVWKILKDTGIDPCPMRALDTRRTASASRADRIHRPLQPAPTSPDSRSDATGWEISLISRR